MAEIGTGSKVLCDIGARLEGSNSENLINSLGFTGVLVEASAVSARQLETAFGNKVKVLNITATPDKVNEIVPGDAWFLSIDIDSSDFWMWANLNRQPAVVVVETNPLPGLFVAKMDCAQKDSAGYGMSLGAAKWLGEAKGYDYLGRTEANAFFVLKKLNCRYRIVGEPPHRGVPCKAHNNVLQGG
jgi:hypothetical protein